LKNNDARRRMLHLDLHPPRPEAAAAAATVPHEGLLRPSQRTAALLAGRGRSDDRAGIGAGAEGRRRLLKRNESRGKHAPFGNPAVITGGTQGLGLAIAKASGRRKGRKSIVISGRNFEKGEAAAKAISGMGTPCEFVKTEMGNPEDAKRLIAAAIDTFGSVNALVNSAAETGAARFSTPASRPGKNISTPTPAALPHHAGRGEASQSRPASRAASSTSSRW
jgi:hypothetical protein